MRQLLGAWLLATSGLVAGDGVWREAVLGLRSDATGEVWNFQENGEIGRVGASAVNRGQVLYVNGSAFAAQSAYMNEAGNEFLFSGQAGGVQETLVLVRRVRLDPDTGVVRYLEMLRNEGTESRTIRVEIRTNLNGYYDHFVSDQGRAMPVRLSESERGFWLAPAMTKEKSNGYAFAVAGAGAEVRPALGSKRKYVVSVHYELEVGAGKTAVLLHAVRQVALADWKAGLSFPEIFGPLDLNALQAGISPSVRKALVNVGSGGSRESLFEWESPSRDGEEQDVLVTTDGGEWKGRLTGKLSLTTDRGEVEAPVSDWVALEMRSDPGTGRVWLHSGEILTGIISGDALRLETSFGTPRPVQVETVQMIRRAQDSEAEPEGTWVTTRRGERFMLEDVALEAWIEWQTAHGGLSLPLSDVQNLRAGKEGDEFGWLELADGSRFRARAVKGRFTPGGRGAETSIPVTEMEGLVRYGREGSAMPEPPLGWVELRSGERWGWRDQDQRVALETKQGVIEVPLQEVKRLQGRERGVEVELWDGSVFPATLREGSTLTLDEEESLQVTWKEVVKFETHPVGAREGREKELEAALKDLKAEDWATRRRGEAKLLDLGALAIPELRAGLQSDDVDFVHRLGLILEELERGGDDEEF